MNCAGIENVFWKWIEIENVYTILCIYVSTGEGGGVWYMLCGNNWLCNDHAGYMAFIGNSSDILISSMLINNTTFGKSNTQVYCEEDF